MAEMIPPRLRKGCPTSERKVFKALSEQLPNTCTVYHSVAWQGRGALGDDPRDGECDFVIVHPAKGILCMEVKGGGISCDGSKGQWLSEDRNGKKHKIKNPLSQVVDSKHALLDCLKALSGWPSVRMNVGHCVAFPDCSYSAKFTGPQVKREILLFSEDLRRIEEKILTAYDFYSPSYPIQPISDQALSLLRNFLAPSFELKTLASFLRDTEEEIISLTDAQLTVLDSLARNRRFAVCGGAGTGKTLLAREKAVRLANSGMRTLLTCYNRPLADFLASTVLGVKNLTVLGFQQLCDQMAKAAGIKISAEKFDSHYYEELLPNALYDALEKLPARRFDALVVDEAQDFPEEWWIPLQMVLEDPDRGILFVFYDDNQRIYRRESKFLKEFPNIGLPTNLRNTKKIYQLADLFYHGGKFDHEGPAGRKVDYIEAEPGHLEETIGDHLKKLIEEEDVDPSDIAVLTGRSRDHNFLARNGKYGKYSVTRNVQEGKVLFESIHRFKGLERPIVILTQLRTALENDELLYVGITRARSHLIVISSAPTVRALRTRLQKLRSR